jgi:hypothetical protein
MVSSNNKTELNFKSKDKTGFFKIEVARKPAKKKIRNDKIMPVSRTKKQAERKSSLILSVSFSAARKRMMLRLKANVVKGIIKVIAVIIKAQIPYCEDPSALVMIGSCMMPSTIIAILAATTYMTRFPKIVYASNFSIIDYLS